MSKSYLTYRIRIILANFLFIAIGNQCLAVQGQVDPGGGVDPGSGGGANPNVSVSGPNEVIAGRNIDFTIQGSNGTAPYSYLAVAQCKSDEPKVGAAPFQSFYGPQLPNVFVACASPIGTHTVSAGVKDATNAFSPIVEQDFEVLGPDDIKPKEEIIVVVDQDGGSLNFPAFWEFELFRGEEVLGGCIPACLKIEYWAPAVQPGPWNPEDTEPTVFGGPENCGCQSGFPQSGCITPPTIFFQTTYATDVQSFANIPNNQMVHRSAVKFRVELPTCGGSKTIVIKAFRFDCKKKGPNEVQWKISAL